jgi:hypothetical protein
MLIRYQRRIFYNKDVDLFAYPEGHMELKKVRTGRIMVRYNSKEIYYFDIKYCKICPLKSGVLYRRG